MFFISKPIRDNPSLEQHKPDVQLHNLNAIIHRWVNSYKVKSYNISLKLKLA